MRSFVTVTVTNTVTVTVTSYEYYNGLYVTSQPRYDRNQG
jgi:hypothetical protein